MLFCPNNTWLNQVHWLVGTPYLSIKASNDVDHTFYSFALVYYSSIKKFITWEVLRAQHGNLAVLVHRWGICLIVSTHNWSDQFNHVSCNGLIGISWKKLYVILRNICQSIWHNIWKHLVLKSSSIKLWNLEKISRLWRHIDIDLRAVSHMWYESFKFATLNFLHEIQIL